MKNTLAVIGFLTVGYFTLYVIGLLVEATPEWLATAIIIGLFVGLPVLALIKLSKFYLLALKEEGKL